MTCHRRLPGPPCPRPRSAAYIAALALGIAGASGRERALPPRPWAVVVVLAGVALIAILAIVLLALEIRQSWRGSAARAHAPAGLPRTQRPPPPALTARAVPALPTPPAR